MKCLKTGRYKGSITVEAAIVLPIFIFFILSVVYVTGLFRVESIIGSSLMEASKNSAMNSYATEEVLGEVVSEGVEALVSTVSAKTIMKEKVGTEYLDKCGIRNGIAGIMCLGDSFSIRDRVKITATYSYEVPFNVFSKNAFWVKQAAVSRKWTGYDILEDSSDEEMVYVTKNGSVYHESPNCSHIKLDIKSVDASSLGSLRNEDGCKYYPCEVCAKKKKVSGTVYVTGFGTCYHTSLECGGLKRSVTAVPKSKVSGMAACQRCGGIYE